MLDGLRLLLVDPDRDFCDAVALYLERYGCSLDTVPDLAQAQSAVAAHPYDVRLVELKSLNGRGAAIPDCFTTTSGGVILFSGLPDRAKLVAALENGADDFIVKPFHPRELKARVLALARRLPDRSGRKRHIVKLTIKDCVLDRDQLGLFLPGGQVVDLSRIEFDVLWTLAMASNRILSRAQILDEVYGPLAVVSDRMIDYHLCRIRSKIRGADAPLRIATRRGLGYVLESDRSAS